MKTYELTYKRGDESLTYRTPSLASALDMADRCGAAELFLTVEDEPEQTEPRVKPVRPAALRGLLGTAAMGGSLAAAALAVGILFRVLGV